MQSNYVLDEEAAVVADNIARADESSDVPIKPEQRMHLKYKVSTKKRKKVKAEPQPEAKEDDGEGGKKAEKVKKVKKEIKEEELKGSIVFAEDSELWKKLTRISALADEFLPLEKPLRMFTRRHICNCVGGNLQCTVPAVGKSTVDTLYPMSIYSALMPKWNPQFPPRAGARGVFLNSGMDKITRVPMFCKRNKNLWEYCGTYSQYGVAGLLTGEDWSRQPAGTLDFWAKGCIERSYYGPQGSISLERMKEGLISGEFTVGVHAMGCIDFDMNLYHVMCEAEDHPETANSSKKNIKRGQDRDFYTCILNKHVPQSPIELNKDDALTLKHEPHPKDKNMIRVYRGGDCVGHLPVRFRMMMAPLVDKGLLKVSSRVSSLKKGKLKGIFVTVKELKKEEGEMTSCKQDTNAQTLCARSRSGDSALVVIYVATSCYSGCRSETTANNSRVDGRTDVTTVDKQYTGQYIYSVRKTMKIGKLFITIGTPWDQGVGPFPTHIILTQSEAPDTLILPK
ncbi:hypothetical protein PROFUN_11570 [Planoprotostelium fungivorum]|uniref:DUF6697 domain-containing protein n=1 Tax=Planoprotostelium fungivorum TaxID=1890364 RepID=A0A2P6N9J5_9EUKA|nr:hypothetical protein PROFUN_11570 [Planoprotostelium fungivorum]